MNWTDDKIDQLFKEAAEQQRVEYSPEYWKEIEALLPAQKQKKRLGWKFFLGSLSLVICTGIIGCIALTSTTSISPEKHNRNQLLVLSSSQKSTVANEKQAAETPLTNSSLNTKDTQFPIANQVFNHTVKQPKRRQLTFATSNAANPLKTGALTSSPVAATSQQGLANTTTTTRLANPRTETDEQAMTQRATHELPIHPLSSFSASTAFLDTTSLKKQAPALYPRLRWYTELNGGLSQAWTRTETSSVNGSLGVLVGVILPLKKINLSAGIGFQATKLNDLKIEDRTKIYGFGATLIEQNYQISSLYSLTLPLHISYSFGRHTLEMGAVTSLNLAMRLRYWELLDNQQTVYNSTVGAIQLLSRIGIKPTIGYAFSINETTQLGVQVGLQLIRPIDSDRFVGSSVRLPFEGQFYLRKSLNFNTTKR